MLLPDLVARLRDAGAMTVSRFDGHGDVHVLFPAHAAQAAAEILDECRALDGSTPTRTEKSVIVDDDEGLLVKVHVGVIVELEEALLACVSVLAREAGDLDRVEQWVSSFAYRPHGLELEEARLESLAMLRVDEGEFGSQLDGIDDDVRLAVGLLMADYVCADELPTMGHCVEAVVRYRDVLATAWALARLDESERRRLSVRPVSAAGPEPRGLS